MTTHLQWWDDFKEDNREDEELVRIINKIEGVKQSDSSHMIMKISKEIGLLTSKGYSPETTGLLNKKLKILFNRRERRVSEEFGSYIRYLREKSNMTLATLANLTGVSPSYINRIELGQRNSPSIVIVEKLAKGLSVPFYEIAEKSGIDLGLPLPVEEYYHRLEKITKKVMKEDWSQDLEDNQLRLSQILKNQ